MAISTEVRGVRANPELRTRAHQVLQQTAPQRPEVHELLNDRTRISDELMDEVGKAMQSQGPGSNLDALLGAVAQNFLERKAEEAGPVENGKEKKKKMDVEWAPEVRAGEIMPPQGYTGQLIYKESKDQPQEDAVQPTGKAGKAGKAGAGKPGGGAAPTAAAKPGAARAQGAAKNAPSDGNSKEIRSDDTVELTAEGQKMSQQLQQGGMKPAGTDTNGAKLGGAKAEERVDVHMPALGTTQIVDVRPAGQLAADGVLGTYRKLDDMPAWNGAILKKRTGKEVVQEHEERRERGEKVEPLSEEQKQKLMNPVATHK